MIKVWKTVKLSALVILGLITTLVISLFFLSPGKTPFFKTKTGEVEKSSVAEMGYLEIGGIEQFVVERGISVQNPVLLILHGGPGTTEMPTFREYNEELEKYFIVIHWDQRGASNSYNSDIPQESMTLEQFIKDTHELTLHLKQKYGKDKIFLLGHSWGSYLGIKAAAQYPDDYHAYIGTGQMSNQFESERIGYEFALNKAREFKEAASVKTLKELGMLDKEIRSNEEIISWVYEQRRFVGQYGGVTYEKSLTKLFLRALVFCQEYTLSDKLGIFAGSRSSVSKLFPLTLKDDLSQSTPELKIPVFFLQGTHDYVTSCTEAKAYFDTLVAPRKKFITFDRSGHSPPFEEPEKFNKIMIEKVLK